MPSSNPRQLVAAIAAFLLPLAALAAPDEAEITELELEPVVAEPTFRTQRTDLVLFRPLGDVLRLGEHEFVVDHRGRKFKLATKAGGKPDKTVKSDKTIALDVPRAEGELGRGDTREVHVHFRRSDDAEHGWEYVVVEARELTFDTVTAQLVDIDADGRFEVGRDAVRWLPSDFVVPLPQRLVVGRTAVELRELSTDGLRADALVAPLDGSRHQLDGLVVLNELRADSGLPPVEIDPTLSEGCSRHAEYLLENDWRPGKWDPHGQVDQLRGYCEEGHLAGRASVIAMGDHGNSVLAHWNSYYHRFPLLHPATRRVGLSDGTPSLSVLDALTDTPRDPDSLAGWRDPVLCPADGATRVPTDFHPGGERPEPVEDPSAKGFPLVIHFLDRNPEVTELHVTLVEIDKRGREEEVELLDPVPGSRRDSFGAIPARSLKSNARYRVTYSYYRAGELEEVSATFVCR